jgi:hypothetical protein
MIRVRCCQLPTASVRFAVNRSDSPGVQEVMCDARWRWRARFLLELYVQKSTSAHAAGHHGAAPLDDEPTGRPAKIIAPFAASSYCAGNGACVEVAPLATGGWAVRDGKQGDAGPVLSFTAGEWAAFVAGIKAGELQ